MTVIFCFTYFVLCQCDKGYKPGLFCFTETIDGITDTDHLVLTGISTIHNLPDLLPNILFYNPLQDAVTM